MANDELAEIWKALPANDFGTILRLLILTGQRKREIADLRWPEVNLDRGVIACAPRQEQARSHTIPLLVAAAVILDKQMRREGRDLVFGAGHGGFGGWSKAKSKLDQAIFEARKKANKKAKPMEPWIVHDLRRAVATGMAEIGVQPHDRGCAEPRQRPQGRRGGHLQQGHVPAGEGRGSCSVGRSRSIGHARNGAKDRSTAARTGVAAHAGGIFLQGRTGAL